MKNIPSINRLNQLFELSGGNLIRKISVRGYPIGSIVGSGQKSRNYKKTSIDGYRCLLHRAIFAMANNRWPTMSIDHVNGRVTDNRPENLREATTSQNAHNRKTPTTNKSGVLGVSWSNQDKWKVQISLRGKVIYLGCYGDLDLAALVRSEAVRKYHGEFARTE